VAEVWESEWAEALGAGELWEAENVTRAIIERDGFVLAAQRSAMMSLPLKWEFPGGKIDQGESPEECLRREIAEEMNIQVEIGCSLPPSTHKYPVPSRYIHLSAQLRMVKSIRPRAVDLRSLRIDARNTVERFIIGGSYTP
jgi:mutator protein MutT